MGKRQHTAEQIIVKMREIEVMCKQGMSVREASRQVGVTDSTYYTWKKQYGSMTTDEAKRLQMLMKENERLKKLVADLALDNQILKEVNSAFC